MNAIVERRPTRGIKLTRATLQSVKLFSRLPEQALDDVLASCRARRYAAGERIVSRYDHHSDVYFIVAGRAKATLFANNGREVTYDILTAGDMFGEVAAIDGLARTTDVEAEADSIVAVINGEMFCALLRKYPSALGEPIMCHLTAMVRRLVERVYEITAYTVPIRVQLFLLREAKKQRSHGNSAEIHFTQKEIAALTRTERCAVNREISRLENPGLVAWERRGYGVVHDIEGLEKHLLSNCDYER